VAAGLPGLVRFELVAIWWPGGQTSCGWCLGQPRGFRTRVVSSGQSHDQRAPRGARSAGAAAAVPANGDVYDSARAVPRLPPGATVRPPWSSGSSPRLPPTSDSEVPDYDEQRPALYTSRGQQPRFTVRRDWAQVPARLRSMPAGEPPLTGIARRLVEDFAHGRHWLGADTAVFESAAHRHAPAQDQGADVARTVRLVQQAVALVGPVGPLAPVPLDVDGGAPLGQQAARGYARAVDPPPSDRPVMPEPGRGGESDRRRSHAQGRHSPTGCHSWLAPPLAGHWMIFAPLAVDPLCTSAHSPLLMLTRR
jgi:hypothetical protein